jgi:hypothetical protein
MSFPPNIVDMLLKLLIHVDLISYAKMVNTLYVAAWSYEHDP